MDHQSTHFDAVPFKPLRRLSMTKSVGSVSEANCQQMSLLQIAVARRNIVNKGLLKAKRRVTFQTQATGEVFQTQHVYPPALGETSPQTLYYTLNERRRKQKLMYKEIAECTYIDNSFARSVEALFLSSEHDSDEDIKDLAVSITQHSCRGLERRVTSLSDRRRDCLRQQLLRLQSRLRDEDAPPDVRSQLLSDISIVFSKKARLFAERIAIGDAVQSQCDSSGVAKAA